MDEEKQETVVVIVDNGDILFAWGNDGGFGRVEYSITEDQMEQVDWISHLREKDWWCPKLEKVFLSAMNSLENKPTWLPEVETQ